MATALLSGCGEASPPTPSVGSHREAIAGGELDTQHTSVVALLTVLGSQGVGLCTGTLIAPNLVLTARHCVTVGPETEGPVICGEQGTESVVPGVHIAITTEPDVDRARLWYPGERVLVPPESSDACGFDVALVVLAGAGVPQGEAVPSAPRLDRVVRTGDLYTAVGYGQTGRAASSAGQRQARTGLTVLCEPGTCAGAVRSREFMGESGVCEGDSGGPALDREGRVLGVASRGTGLCDAPIYAAVSHFRAWLVEVASSAAAAGGYPRPAWASLGDGGSGDHEPSKPSRGDAGAGSAPTPNASGAEAQGRPCGESAACPDGYACFYADDPTAAYCTATCTRGCADDLICDEELAVCVPHERPEASGCSAVPGRRPVSGLVFLMGSALAAARLRRRHRWR